MRGGQQPLRRGGRAHRDARHQARKPSLGGISHGATDDATFPAATTERDTAPADHRARPAPTATHAPARIIGNARCDADATSCWRHDAGRYGHSGRRGERA